MKHPVLARGGARKTRRRSVRGHFLLRLLFLRGDYDEFSREWAMLLQTYKVLSGTQLATRLLIQYLLSGRGENRTLLVIGSQNKFTTGGFLGLPRARASSVILVLLSALFELLAWVA